MQGVENSDWVRVGTFVLYDECFAGLVVDNDKDQGTVVLQLEEYWPCLDDYDDRDVVVEHGLKEMGFTVCDEFKLPENLGTRPASVYKFQKPLVRNHTPLYLMHSGFVKELPVTFPPYIETLQRHFKELLEMTRERVKCVKQRSPGDYFGFTKPGDLYFGVKGRTRVFFRFDRCNILVCAPALLTYSCHADGKVPVRQNIIYHKQVGRKPCWFLADDYPGLDEFLGYLKGFRDSPPVDHEWVSDYFTEEAQNAVQWAYLLRGGEKINTK